MHYADYKTILSPKNSMNLYRGCSHGCIYCDSRSTCYQIKHAFEDIEVKRHAVQILEGQLRRKRKVGMIGTGAMCDPYIQLEKDLKMTRKALETIERSGFGLSILTKSSLILRDLELLKAINQKTKCVVQITMTTYDDSLCKKLEPNVATTIERFRVLQVMKKNNIPTVVWLTPILPFINDTEENLRGLLGYCVEAGVRGIVCPSFGMTLREGNREYFYTKLEQFFPGMTQHYARFFGNAYLCDSPNNPRLMTILSEECERHGIMWKPADIFHYLHAFESKNQQLSLF